MITPTRNKHVMRYLETIQNDSDNPSSREPLKPSSRDNMLHLNRNKSTFESSDLDQLAQQLNVSPTKTPGRTERLRSKFESPSVTVSAFKSPQKNAGAENWGRARPQVQGNNRDKSLGAFRGLTHESSLTTPKGNNSSNASTNFSKDINNKASGGYEYLCRILAIKKWLETVISEPINETPVEMITYLRNGIYLAKLANAILPSKKTVYMNDSRLQFKHTENINRFFQLLDYLKVPEVFSFELTDLYDAKDIPKVWLCLHAMSYMLHKLDNGYPQVENLVGEPIFSEEDITTANRALRGTGLPNFSSIDTNASPVKKGENSYMNRALAEANFDSFDNQVNPVYSSPKKSKEEDHRVSFSNENYAEPTFKQEAKNIGLELYDKDRNIDRDLLHQKSVHTTNIDSNVKNIVKLQSLSRGAIFRYRMFVDRIILKLYAEELNSFIAISRGYLSRGKTIHRHRCELMLVGDTIEQLQAAIKRHLVVKKLPCLRGYEGGIEQLQSTLRGWLVRNKVTRCKNGLLEFELSLKHLQALSRTKLVGPKSRTVLANRGKIEPIVLDLQAISRGRILRQTLTRNRFSLFSLKVEDLQAIMRGRLLCKTVTDVRERIQMNSPTILDLQSIIRGGMMRSLLCNDCLVSLMFEKDHINDLKALAKGLLVRKRLQTTKQELVHVGYSSTLSLQSHFRGVLSRFRSDILLEDLYSNLESIVSLQALSRSCLFRRSIVSMRDYYWKNVNKVIKIQSLVRGAIANKAYKSLINLRNPPLIVVKRFAFLLIDSNFDYDEEVQLNQLQDKIIEKARHNESLESQIEEIEVKLSLLDKNKITVEEFLKNKSKYKTYKPATSSVNVSNLEKLNKSARERIDIYQTMFYFLQTKPLYLIRLLNNTSVGSKLSKQVYECVKAIYPYKIDSWCSHPREEYLLVKFTVSVMQEDLRNRCKYLNDFTKMYTCFWMEYFLILNNTTAQRIHLKSLLGGLLQNILDDDEAVFQSNPCEIYSSLCEKEKRISGIISRNPNVSPQDAIKDPEVSSIFVLNLLGLRETCTNFITILSKCVDKIPVHVRLISKTTYDLCKLTYPEKSTLHHLSVAGVCFFKYYVSMILQYPENFGYFSTDTYSGMDVDIKKFNLQQVNKVMLQLFAMKPFNENFFKPLNDYINSMIPNVSDFINSIIDVKSIEEEYGFSEYDDIVTHNRPKLTMKMTAMIQIEKFLSDNIELIVTSRDDQLFNLIMSLNNINFANDILTLTELGSVTLNLNPKTKEDSIADARVNTLISRAKRFALYVISVQDGDDLLEILISGITPEHEEKFKEVVKGERALATHNARKKDLSYGDTSIVELESMSYRELKKKALETLIQLENTKKITRRSSFQELLNLIALDMKTKHAQRVSRKSQLRVAIETHDRIIDKEVFLQKQLKDFSGHMGSVLSQLQLKPKDKKIFNIIPVFGKQYFYQRELRKSNRLPKFGSYKYSAKKLQEKDIIVDFGGLLYENYTSASKLDFMFSCHNVGKFTIEAANGAISVPGASSLVTVDQLLKLQYENRDTLELFDGMVSFDTQNLIGFIFEKFYDISKESV